MKPKNERFNEIDHDIFIEKTVKILTALHHDVNRETLESIDYQNNDVMEYYQNINKWKKAFHKENFSELAEAVLLFKLILLKCKHGIIHHDKFFFRIQHYVDKQIFLEKYYELIKEQLLESLQTSEQLKIHFYSEQYGKILPICDKLIDCYQSNSTILDEIYYIRGITKQKLRKTVKMI